MADTKLSALVQLTAPASADELVAVDKSDTTMAASGSTKRVTLADLLGATSGVPVALVSNVGTWGRAIEDLRGDQLGYAATGANLTPGLWQDVRVGTAASPVTGSSGKGGLIKLSKTEDLRVADFVNGSTNEQSAPLVVHTKNAATSEVQCAGAYIVAETLSTSATGGANKDAMGLAATGRVTGSGTGRGIGGYFVGRRDTNTGTTNGLEVRAWNETATDQTYNSTGASNGMGLWLSCSGPSGAVNRLNGPAIQIGKATDGAWDVGLAAAKIGGLNPIVTTFIRDDTDATDSILVNGTHTRALGVASGAGYVVVGAAARLHAASLFSVQSTSNTDPIAEFGSNTSAVLHSVRLRNADGMGYWFIAGGANHFLTGTATGDVGFKQTTSGKSLMLGGTARVVQVTADDKLGFFATTPVVKSTNAITLTNYTVGARSLDRSSYTMDQLADVVCELVKQLGDTAGVGLVNDA